MAKRKKTTLIIALLTLLAVGLGAGTGAFFALWQPGQGGAASGSASGGSSASTPGQSQPAASSAPVVDDTAPDLSAITPRSYAAMPLPDEMRAMWISFLELEKVDLSTEAAARAALGTMFDNCAATGLNTVIVHVRPLADALYKSGYYPWSHLLGGTQGQNPGYDPLAVMIEEAHARGLRFEAWVNPYRVQHPKHGPETLSADNYASQNPGAVHDVNGTLWYDPGIPEVQNLIINGVLEIVQNYDVDGVHYDDYFYPEFLGDDAADEAFDAESFGLYAGGLARGEWRRANVNSMVSGSYAAIKAANPTVSFGISVQGNNENNYATMYADVRSWMAADSFCDYIMPQLYWGFGHQTASGRTDYAFDNITATWASWLRSDSVKLYAGLATYRIGMLQPDGTRADFGGNGSGDNSEWESGNVMASQVAHLRTVGGFSGFALFRYDFLYQPEDTVSAQENAALQAALQG